MANNYSQFSEMIDNITQEEARWISTVLNLSAEDEDKLQQLKRELGLEPDGGYEFDMWPYFEWQLEDRNSLWLYSEEGLNEEHLGWFVQAFINKFRPDYIFTATGAATCSKPRIGEFGGWWLVVSRDEIAGGNTWDAAQAEVKAISNRTSP